MKEDMASKSSRVLFIGRFQPFHRGHEKILAHLLRRYAGVTIAIGSAQERRTKDNPFSARERREMIAKVASSHAGWKRRISFAFLADRKSNADWTGALQARFPPSSFAVASANPLVRKLAKGAKYTLDPSPLFARAKLMGKRIREKVRESKSIRGQMPASLEKWMEEKGKKIIGRWKRKGRK
ncbi:Nicotinamide-nucleotide adenylyltransferase [uncultured archaeon]|nr:Nicotinamide-nucleotide adenylyltransferase [uncultured archaeon]